MRQIANEAACRAHPPRNPGRSRWDVPREPSALEQYSLSERRHPGRSVPVEDHFWRWHHPGRCPGGDQQPPQPPDHLIASAAWRPKSPLFVVSCLTLHCFYTCSFVCVPRQKRKQLAGKGFIGRAEVGRLMGIRSPFSTTYKVLLSENRMVHSINVNFDDSNCTNKRALPSPPQSEQLVDVSIKTSGATEEERGLRHHSHHSPQSHLQPPSQQPSPSQHSTSQFLEKFGTGLRWKAPALTAPAAPRCAVRSLH